MTSAGGVDLERVLKVAMQEHAIRNGCEYAHGAFDRLRRSKGFALLEADWEAEETCCGGLARKLQPGTKFRMLDMVGRAIAAGIRRCLSFGTEGRSA